jgi:hypothetical protein
MSRVLNTVVELIRLEDKLELLHINFSSLQICFVRQLDEACHTHQVNLNNALNIYVYIDTFVLYHMRLVRARSCTWVYHVSIRVPSCTDEGGVNIFVMERKFN